MAINKHITPWRRRKESELDVHRETDPFLTLHDDMNRVFATFFERPYDLQAFDGWEGFSPNLDVYETDKVITVEVELPGMDEKDIDVSVHNDVLTISGEKSGETTEKNKSFHRHERSYGAFRRSIQLPDEVDEDKIEAVYSKGILRIVLPRTEQSVTARRRIEIKRG